MNIYYFDLSVDCSLFFISLLLDPITLCLSLAFSIFTHYPLTHFLTHTLSTCLSHSIILHLFYSTSTFPLLPHSPLPSSLLLCITSTVGTRRLPSKLELLCQYSEWLQVQGASWKYQNKSRQLRMSSNHPGSVTTTVSLPITRDTAGNYTCTLKLKNGQTIWATQVVTLPSEGWWDGLVRQRWNEIIHGLLFGFFRL